MGDSLISDEALAALLPILKEQGISVEGLDKIVPEIREWEPLRVVGEKLGGLLSKSDLFRLGNSRNVVTIGHKGMLVPMTSKRFRTWIERDVRVMKKAQNGSIYEGTISEGTSATLLDTDEFLNRIPQLNGVARVRCPVKGGDGSIRLMERGYDESSGLYCCDEIEFDKDWSCEKAIELFDELLCEFDFPDGKWAESRSGGVQVAAILGSFCRHLFSPGETRPMMFYIGNLSGAGKSLLVSMALAAMEGMGSSTNIPLLNGGRVDEAELGKILAKAAQDQESVLWLDDAPRNLKCNALNSFVTAQRHKGRILGKPGGYDEEAVTQVFLTGNLVEVTPDLMRRSLICELFATQDPQSKQVKLELTPQLLSSLAWRKKLLSASWALVRDWQESGAATLANPKPKGFQGWVGLIGGMLTSAGLPDIGVVPDLPMAGDTQGEEVRKLMIALADDEDDPVDISVSRVIEVARIEGLLAEVIGESGDDLPKAKERRILGVKLKGMRGQVMRDSRGRIFEFGQRHQKSGSVYPLRFLDNS